MKRTILAVIMFLLATAMTAQLGTVGKYKIPNADTPFGQKMSNGDQVYDVSAKVLWLLTEKTSDNGATLNTISEKTELPGAAVGATGLESITEAGKTGWRLIGDDPTRYGNTGGHAVTISLGSTSGTTGATGDYSFSAGQATTSSGFTSFAINMGTVASGVSSFAGGSNSSASGTSSFTFQQTGNSETYVNAGSYSAILGGRNNIIQTEGTHSAIIGGYTNNLTGKYSVILGGKNLSATQDCTAFIPRVRLLQAFAVPAWSSVYTGIIQRDLSGSLWYANGSEWVRLDTIGGADKWNSFGPDTNFIAPKGEKGAYADRMKLGQIYSSENIPTHFIGRSPADSLMTGWEIKRYDFKMFIQAEAEPLDWTDVINGALTWGVLTGNRHFVVSDTMMINGTISIPAGMHITFEPGGYLKDPLNTADVIGNGTRISADRHQLFDQNMEVSGNLISSNGIYPPEWMGAKNDSTYNSTVGARKCLALFGGIDFDGHYQITDSLHISRNNIITMTPSTKIWWNPTTKQNFLSVRENPVYINGNEASIYTDRFGAEGSLIYINVGYSSDEREGGSTSPVIAGTQVGRYGFYIGNLNFKGFNWIAPAITAYATGDSIRITSSSSPYSFENLEPIRIEKANLSSTITMPGGLDAATVYYVIRLSNRGARLATSRANAEAGTYIDLTSAGSNLAANIFTNEAPNGIVCEQYGGGQLYFPVIENIYMQKMDTMVKVWSNTSDGPLNGWLWQNVVFDTPINVGLQLGNTTGDGNNHENIMLNMMFQQARNQPTIYLYEGGNYITGSFFDAASDSCMILYSSDNYVSVGLDYNQISDHGNDNNLWANEYGYFYYKDSKGRYTRSLYLGANSNPNYGLINAMGTELDIQIGGSTKWVFTGSTFRARSTSVLPELGSSAIPFIKFYSKNIRDDGTNAIAYGTFKADTIAEKDAGSGVIIDGVLLKDGVIPATAIPSSVAVRGTRLRIDFSSPWSQITDTDSPLALQFFKGMNYMNKSVDLTDYSQVRFTIERGGSASAGAGYEVYLRYYTSSSRTASDYLTLGTTEVKCDANSVSVKTTSGWIDLVTGAKADVILTVLTAGGNGAADPNFGTIQAEFK